MVNIDPKTVKVEILVEISILRSRELKNWIYKMSVYMSRCLQVALKSKLLNRCPPISLEKYQLSQYR